jgi:hypothetical protein
VSKTRSILENVVLAAIVLVLLQTLFEDLAVLLGWTVSVRNGLLVAGFAFDVFFTIEFLVRSYDAWRNRGFRRYLWLDRGWIDFLASVPLLVLNSGPSVLALYVGGVAFAGAGGMLNVLKVVKAIRISRVLRLLRALKLFRKIKNTDSVMAQRHVATISTTIVSVFVFVLILLALGGTVVTVPSIDLVYQEQATAGVDYLVEQGLAEDGRESELQAYAGSRPEILSVEVAGEVRYSRFGEGYLRDHYRPADYAVLARGPVEVFVDLLPLNQAQASRNLQYFVVIVVLILVMMFLYSPHFAMTISDPIHVMRRGMTEKSYNLEVRVPMEYRDDDVYRLAAEYNRTYLPMKDRENASDEGESSTSLSMNDVAGLFD